MAASLPGYLLDRQKTVVQSEEVNHRIGEARKACGALKDLWKKRHISREAKLGIYKGIFELSLLYGCKAWTLIIQERKRTETVEMT